MSEQPTLGVPVEAPLTCPRCGGAVVEADHVCIIPESVHRDTVRRFIESIGFRSSDVKDMALDPFGLDVTLYKRDPVTGAVRTKAGGVPETRTVRVRMV